MHIVPLPASDAVKSVGSYRNEYWIFTNELIKIDYDPYAKKVEAIENRYEANRRREGVLLTIQLCEVSVRQGWQTPHPEELVPIPSGELRGYSPFCVNKAQRQFGPAEFH